MTIIISDIIFASVVWNFAKHFSQKYDTKKILINPDFIICIGLILNTGLIIADNMHFFYNSFLFSIFLISVLCIIKVFLKISKKREII